MAANGGLKNNETRTKKAGREKNATEAVQVNKRKPWKLPGKIPKSKMSKDVQIVEDVEKETLNLPVLAVDTRENSNICADEKHIRELTALVTSQQNDSLTVPGALPGSSDVVEEQKSLSVKRELSRLSLKSNKSIDSRIRNAVVQMPPGAEEPAKTVLDPDESWIRSAIPKLLIGQAIACLIMNVIIPGTGTMLSGFFIFCGGKSRVPSKSETDAIMTLCVNIWVGVSQLFTVSFLLVGWFWSLAWGVNMVILSGTCNKYCTKSFIDYTSSRYCTSKTSQAKETFSILMREVRKSIRASGVAEGAEVTAGETATDYGTKCLQHKCGWKNLMKKVSEESHQVIAYKACSTHSRRTIFVCVLLDFHAIFQYLPLMGKPGMDSDF